jgi:hypothetical protein
MSEKNEAKLRRERWLKQSTGPARILKERVELERPGDEANARRKAEERQKKGETK